MFIYLKLKTYLESILEVWGFIWGLSPSSAQGLFLSLCISITPGGTQETIAVLGRKLELLHEGLMP